LQDERGFAMAGLMLVILLVMAFGSFSVFQTSLEQRSTSHADTANRAMFAAESGVMHALNRINSAGVIDFEKDVYDRWSEILGDSAVAMVSDPNATYEVSLGLNAANPADRGSLTVIGRGPLLARRTVQISLAKSNFAGSRTAGTIHVAAEEGVAANFQGNLFEVNGNNFNRFGVPENDGVAIAGITALNTQVKDAIVNSLGGGQTDNVRGVGYDADTATPSILTTSGPDVAALKQFAANILARPGVFTSSDSHFNGGDVFGTVDSPQITHMTHNDVRLNGNATGAGILIADGSVKINGTLDFVGLIISLGEDWNFASGNSMILGSIWTTNVSIGVGGSAIIDYCYECLWIADNVGGTPGAIPRSMRIVSWSDVL
jgi:hypothetical protein